MIRFLFNKNQKQNVSGRSCFWFTGALSLIAFAFLFSFVPTSAGPKQDYLLKFTAHNLQAYWKDDVLIVGIIIDVEGRTQTGTPVVNPYGEEPQPERWQRYLSIVFVKGGHAEHYQILVEKTSDDTIYPYQETVYCKFNNKIVLKLENGVFQKIEEKESEEGKHPYGSLWLEIINQRLEDQGWKEFQLWDEGPDEIEPTDHISESCRVVLTSGPVFLKREVNQTNPDEEEVHGRYFLTGLKDTDPLVFADCYGIYQPVTQEEYKKNLMIKDR